MSDIIIRRSHTLTPVKARKAAENIAARLGEEFDLEYRWDGDVLHFRRPGVTGNLILAKHQVEIKVRLGFLLLAIRPKVEQEIHRYCDQNFGREAKTRI